MSWAASQQTFASARACASPGRPPLAASTSLSSSFAPDRLGCDQLAAVLRRRGAPGAPCRRCLAHGPEIALHAREQLEQLRDVLRAHAMQRLQVDLARELMHLAQ